MRCEDEWTAIKSLLAEAHCGRDPSKCYFDDMQKRRMIIAFMPDNHDLCSTIFVSLSGSPPKAYAIIYLYDWPFDPERHDTVKPFAIKILRGDLKHYRTLYPQLSLPERLLCLKQLSIKKLLSRNDVVIVNHIRIGDRT